MSEDRAPEQVKPIRGSQAGNVKQVNLPVKPGIRPIVARGMSGLATVRGTPRS